MTDQNWLLGGTPRHLAEVPMGTNSVFFMVPQDKMAKFRCGGIRAGDLVPDPLSSHGQLDLYLVGHGPVSTGIPLF